MEMAEWMYQCLLDDQGEVKNKGHFRNVTEWMYKYLLDELLKNIIVEYKSNGR